MSGDAGGPGHSDRSGTPRPPRWSRALLQRLERPSDCGTLVGDLDEEYVHFQRPRLGRQGADRWYRGQVLRSAPGLLLRRLRSPSRRTGSAALGTDLRVAMRVLRRRPAYALAVVVTLALGLGMNSMLFSVVHAVLMRPLPYADSERLVRPMPDDLFFLSTHEAVELEMRMTSFESIAAWGRSLFLFTHGGEAEEVRGARVGWNHFDMLGVEAALGRTFVADDAVGDDAVVLGHGLWTRHFGADPAIVGRTVELQGRAVRVVGVLGPEHVPIEYDWQAWRTLPLDPDRLPNTGLAANARLRGGVGLEQARDELRTVLDEIWREGGYAMSEEERASVDVVALDDWLLGDARRPLLALFAAATLLLLLACVNVSTLVIAHGGSRESEFAVRLALGSGRLRLGRQLLLEVGLLAGFGALLALAATRVSLVGLASLLPAELPRADAIEVGPEVMAFTALAALCTVLLTGTLPALRASGRRSAGLAGAVGRGSGTRARTRTRFMLVAGQAALTLVLTVSAVLTLRSLATLRAVDPGFDAMAVVTVRPSPPSARYPEPEDLSAYYLQLSERLAALPGVRAVGGIQFLPMTPGGWWASYRPEGTVPADEESRPSTAMRVVRGAYFEAMGIPLLDGRLFDPSEERGEGEAVALVNRRFEEEAFGGAAAVGRSVEVQGRNRRIVGVVGDVRQSDVREGSHAEMYVPWSAAPWRRTHLVVRSDGDDTDALLAAVTREVRAQDVGVSMLGPRRLHRIVEGTFADTRLLTTLLALFGSTGLALGAVGVYGVTARAVAERRRELGIRIALGAAGATVARGALTEGLLPVALGLLLGAPVALLAGRGLEGALYGVDASDPSTLASAAALLMLVSLLALVAPAVRAWRTDPARSLREE